MEKKLRIIRPMKPVAGKREIKLPDRFRLKPELLPNCDLKKITWRERVKIYTQDLLQELIITISDNMLWIKWMSVAFLFVWAIVTWMYCMQEHVEEQLAKPIEKLYQMAIEFGFANEP